LVPSLFFDADCDVTYTNKDIKATKIIIRGNRNLNTNYGYYHGIMLIKKQQ